MLTLCEYFHRTDVHGTIPGFRRPGDGTPPAVFPSALCPVCAARRAAEAARKKKPEGGGFRSVALRTDHQPRRALSFLSLLHELLRQDRARGPQAASTPPRDVADGQNGSFRRGVCQGRVIELMIGDAAEPKGLYTNQYPSPFKSWWKLGSRDANANASPGTAPILERKLPLLSVFQIVY